MVVTATQAVPTRLNPLAQTEHAEVDAHVTQLLVQVVHALDPTTEYCPDGHAMQGDVNGDANVPAEQAVHDTDGLNVLP